MGFRKDQTTAAQTAANVAGVIVSSLVAAGVVKTAAAASKATLEVFQTLFGDETTLQAVVIADNEVFAAQDDAAPAKSSGSKTSSKSTSKSNKAISLEDARSMELKSGKFKGVTLGEVYDMSADEAAEYNHRDGERGRTYITWLATDKNPNDFTRKFAAALLAGVKADGDDEAADG